MILGQVAKAEPQRVPSTFVGDAACLFSTWQAELLAEIEAKKAKKEQELARKKQEAIDSLCHCVIWIALEMTSK